MNKDYGEIFFTEYDDKITGTSKRDPLGFQPIWSYYGRRVIKHLTTVSVDIRGFREVLLCLSICAMVKEKHNNLSYKDLILMFEQLFVYSAIVNGTHEGILGADNGTIRYNNTKLDTKVSSTNPILVRELSLGYYGRYKTPLTTMGVIDSNSNICIDLDIHEMYEEITYNSILKDFERFVSLSADEQKLKNFSALDKLYDAVQGCLRPCEQQFWLEKLQVKGSKKVDLMAKCYKIVDKKQSYKEVFDELIAEREVYDIVNLEPFLRCMESVFYQALGVRNLNQVVIEPEILKIHIERFERFLTITDLKSGNSQMLDERLRYIRENCNPSSTGYIKSIIDYHQMVSKQKQSAAWIELDHSGNIQAFIQPDIDINIDEWGRDYYLSSLSSMKEGIKERI